MRKKFNPFTGTFDFVGSQEDNFSYLIVDDGKTVKIKSGQQMIVDGHVRVLGHLAICGDMVDISGRKKEQFFYDLISEDEVVEVITNRLLLYKGHLTVLGHLRVNGRLEES